MTIHWTPDQVIALAPDASSAKAGKALATPAKWVSTAQNTQIVWGVCRGSSRRAYKTQIDLTGPAYNCTCPSRKFPCKHALGLLLLLTRNPQSIAQGQPPAWVQEWLDKRAARAARTTGPVADPAAQRKRAAERRARITAGLDELERWLRDIARRGLAIVQTETKKFWETPATRLIDAQAPNLARTVKQLAAIKNSGAADWPTRMLDQLGSLHLLIEAFKHFDDLPAGIQGDIRDMLGWTYQQDELSSQPPARDRWLVLGRQTETVSGEDKKLRVQRLWLLGLEQGQIALLQDYARQGIQFPHASLTPGMTMDAELTYYPSAYPLRATLGKRHDLLPQSELAQLPGHPNIPAMYQAWAAALAANPWLPRLPVMLQAITPNISTKMLYDAEGHIVKIPKNFGQHWQMIALSGGAPVGIFGEWDGEYLLPLSLLANGRLTDLTQ